MSTSILAFAVQLLAALPALIAAGKDVTALIENGNAVIAKAQAENRDPNADEWDALDTSIDALRAELHA